MTDVTPEGITPSLAPDSQAAPVAQAAEAPTNPAQPAKTAEIKTPSRISNLLSSLVNLVHHHDSALTSAETIYSGQPPLQKKTDGPPTPEAA